MKKSLIALGLSAALAGPAYAAAPTQAQIQALEARINALEANAEAMRQQAAAATAALEATRAEMEAMKAEQSELASTAAEPPEATAEAEPAPEAASASGANGNAFNPAISIVLNGSYTDHSLNPDDYFRSGFPLVGEGVPADQGFSLGESEISFAANIDEKFYGQLTVAIGNEDGQAELSVEEAFVDTTALPGGLTLRAGEFFSNIGYLNHHHTHTDKFYDRPLVYQAFLANQFGDTGVQLRWVAPTDLFIEVGGEIFRGTNFPSGGAVRGAGVSTLFAHFGGDVGVENSWLAGVSVLDSQTEQADDGFSGDNTLYIADAVWKWAPEGNFKDGGVTVRGEYLRVDRNGDYTNPLDPSLDQVWTGASSGFYLEGVYRINRNWETGYRYDLLWPGDAGPYASTYDPVRHSVMLTWLNSEFSLLRLQYSHDQPNPTDIDNALTLQYQVSLGAHGAHKF